MEHRLNGGTSNFRSGFVRYHSGQSRSPLTTVRNRKQVVVHGTSALLPVRDDTEGTHSGETPAFVVRATGVGPLHVLSKPARSACCGPGRVNTGRPDHNFGTDRSERKRAVKTCQRKVASRARIDPKEGRGEMPTRRVSFVITELLIVCSEAGYNRTRVLVRRAPSTAV